jgi:23S rRNA (cytosine1962-C5)-methyltransferase
MPDRWFIRYQGQTGAQFKLKISLSSFRHVGVFPEQAPNWDFIYKECKRLGGPSGKECSVMNLFAYTGGASLAAASAGAQVTHVDSIKQTVSWANENMQASGMENIRWMVDDAARFAAREARRGKKYQGIILDPPAYGRGPDGEKWVLEEHLQPLLEICAQLLDPEQGFVILNLYSLGYSPLIGANLGERIVRPAVSKSAKTRMRFGELCVGGGQLPLGTYWQMSWGG